MLAKCRLEFVGSGARSTLNSISTMDLCRLNHKGLFVGSSVLMTAFLEQYGCRMDGQLGLNGSILLKFVAWETKQT